MTEMSGFIGTSHQTRRIQSHPSSILAVHFELSSSVAPFALFLLVDLDVVTIEPSRPESDPGVVLPNESDLSPILELRKHRGPIAWNEFGNV